MANNYPQPSSLCEIAHESGHMTFGEGRISGVRVAEVDWAQMIDAVKYFLGAIVLAPDGVEIVYPGDEWPGVANLLAASVTVKPMGKTGNSEWSSIIPATRARLTINYETSAWGSQTGGSTSPENEPYLIESVDYSCEILSVPVKLTDGSNAKEVKRHFRIPTITYVVEIPKIRKPNFSTIADLSGKVNSTTVFGGAAGTVLFDGPKLNREIHQTGDYAWKAVYKFVYNKHGWNNQPHPDTLAWVPHTAVASANVMYESADLTQLWKGMRL